MKFFKLHKIKSEEQDATRKYILDCIKMNERKLKK